MSHGKRPKRERPKRKRAEAGEDLGSLILCCAQCRLPFELAWETIFAIQESTHGYVGFDVSQDYLACPRCGERGTLDDRLCGAVEDIDPFEEGLG